MRLSRATQRSNLPTESDHHVQLKETHLEETLQVVQEKKMIEFQSVFKNPKQR